MADVVTIPVEMAGVAQVLAQLQELFQKTGATAAQVQAAQRLLKFSQTQALKGAGAKEGDYRLFTSLKDIPLLDPTGKPIMELVGDDPLTAELRQVRQDIALQINAKIEEDTQEILKETRRRIKRTAKQGGVKNLATQVSHMRDLSLRVKEQYEEGVVDRNFLEQVRDDVVQMEQALKSAQAADKKKATKTESDKLRRQTKRTDRRTKDALIRINEFATNSVKEVVQAHRDTEELMLKLKKDAGKPGGASESVFDQVQRQEQSLRKRMGALTEAELKDSTREALQKTRSRIKRTASRGGTENLSAQLSRMRTLSLQVMKAYEEGLIPQSFLDTVRDDVVRMEKALGKSKTADKKSAAKAEADKLRQQTKRTDRRTKDALLRINEYSLNSVKEVTQAQREAEELMLKLQNTAGKRGGVSSSVFDQVRRKEQALRQRQESLTKSTASQLQNDIHNDVVKYYDNRRRVIKNQFRSAGNDIEKLQGIFDKQKEMLRELETVTDAGVLNTNQRVEQARAEMRQTAQRLRSATMAQMKRSDRTALMSAEERQAEMNRRAQVHKRAQAETKRRRKERNNVISQGALGAAGVGIGLFGQAGFPLLNVGFAAMSDPKYGAMAGVTTALGETFRAIERFRLEMQAVAEQTGFVTNNFKKLRAESQSVNAVFGGVSTVGEQLDMIRRERLLMKNPTAVVEGIATQQQTSAMFRNFFSDIFQGRMPLNYQRYGDDAATQVLIWQNNLGQMRDNYVKQLTQFSARFEQGGGMWRRIQEAAASRQPDTNKYMQDQIIKLDKVIEAIKKQTDEDQKRFEEWLVKEREKEVLGKESPFTFFTP